jgi:hypothetical protein
VVALALRTSVSEETAFLVWKMLLRRKFWAAVLRAPRRELRSR